MTGCGNPACPCARPDTSPAAVHRYTGATVHVDAVTVRCACRETFTVQTVKGGMAGAMAALVRHIAVKRFLTRHDRLADTGNAIVGFLLAVAVCGAVEAFVLACYLIGQNR